MSGREQEECFFPVKEHQYNRPLPYSHRLQEEAIAQLAEIKAHLSIAFQKRDIKIGATHWSHQLLKYLKLYGYNFSKEDHLSFIHMLLEAISIPHLSYAVISNFANLLSSLLKKKKLISREDLTIQWRPLHRLMRNVTYSRYEYHGLVLFPQNIETVLKTLIHHCRNYFSVESTQEMLDEWRPLMCPYDVKMIEAVYFMEMFLPTKLQPHEQDKGFGLWFHELYNNWNSPQASQMWEKSIFHLFARLAFDTVGQIDWTPYVPTIFTAILRGFNLPVGSAKVHVSRNNGHFDVGTVASWIVNMMGGPNSVVQDHLNDLWSALESFYHPSNYGQYSDMLIKFLGALSSHFVNRVYRERIESPDWTPRIPSTHTLTNAEITAFVRSIMPILLVAMFSKTGAHESKKVFQKLSALRPEIVIPPLLERTYPALETLTEPHRLTASLHCLTAVSRPMVTSTRWYPEGRSHVIPILNLCLPGIDPNDIKKTMSTFQVISSFICMVPLVDCTEALQTCTDLTEEERELCSATAQFEDFVCQFMDRAFSLIENSAQDHIRADSGAATQSITVYEQLIEVGLMSAFNAVVQQSSPAIYDEILRRLFRFVSGNVYEFHVAGRLTGNLIKTVAKKDGAKAFKTFMSHFCGFLRNKCKDESVIKLEHLDHDVLWNLKLLSELVRCDGAALLPYVSDVRAVLALTLHVKCKDGAKLAASLLEGTLRALTMTCTFDYRNSDNGSKPVSEHLPIMDWGKHYTLEDLEIQWHIPSSIELAAARELLSATLLPELAALRAHMAAATSRTGKETETGDSSQVESTQMDTSEGNDAILDREQLKQRLMIVYYSLFGSASRLPMLPGEQINLEDSRVELKRFTYLTSVGDEEISIEGCNVRLLVAETVRPLLAFMLKHSEDDAKSLTQICQVYSLLLFFTGLEKYDFDMRFKALAAVKRSIQNKMYGKKSRLRALLVDRVQLQHELRLLNRSDKRFTELHRDMYLDLFTLATSHYSEVRKVGQQTLSSGFGHFAYSTNVVIDRLVHCLLNGDDVNHHQYKGALYVVYGDQQRCVMMKRSWDIMRRVWPALINGRHSEKPSIQALLDHIFCKLHRLIDTTDIKIQVHDELITAAQRMWSEGYRAFPAPTAPALDETALKKARVCEARQNEANLRMYQELVEELVNSCNNNDLNWKHYQMALELLKLLTRHDVELPSSAVSLFVNNMLHVTLTIRKISLTTVSAILKAHKRPHKKVPYNPYEIAGSKSPNEGDAIKPGRRADNQWLLYDPDNLLNSKEKFENAVIVEKTHWGFYTWPKVMYRYASQYEQPPLGRRREDMTEGERVIYDKFCDESFVEQLIDYLALEENKGKDKFRTDHFLLFKGMLRNYDSAVLPLLKRHLERLVSETAREKHEYSHRLACELIAGILRGSKHWDWDRVKAMWEWLGPLVRTGMANMSVECINDWGTAFATASENRDPRKLHWMFDVLIHDPLRGEGGSFGDESRLFVLQGALAQQEWRVPVLLERTLSNLIPHLSHPYKNVRDRLGSMLVTLLMCAPHLESSLMQEVLPMLNPLRELDLKPNTNGKGHSSMEMSPPVSPQDGDKARSEDAMETGSEGGTEESEERKAAVRLCKTVMKYLQGSFQRLPGSLSPEVFKLLPILSTVASTVGYHDAELREELEATFQDLQEVRLTSHLVPYLVTSVKELCAVQNELKDPELKQDAIITLALLSHTHSQSHLIPELQNTVQKVAQMRSWHARAAILHYLQVAIFCNLFLLQDANFKTEVEALVISLLADEQLEVRTIASDTLCGLLHCGYFKVTPALTDRFRKLASTGDKRRRRGAAASPTSLSPEQLRERHAGVLGLCACVQAYPYDVPEFVPEILMMLSAHLNASLPIQMTVRKTLSNFKRTHYDNWHDHKQKFTDDQLVGLTDLLVSPNYYA